MTDTIESIALQAIREVQVTQVIIMEMEKK